MLEGEKKGKKVIEIFISIDGGGGV